MVYVQDARRTIDGTEQDAAIFEEIERSCSLGARMKLANRYAKLLGMVAVRPVWRNNTLDLDVVTPDLLDVQTGDSPEEVQAILVTYYPEDGKETEVTYSLWTPETFQRLDYRGLVLEESSNPYKVIPYVYVWNSLPTITFWTPSGEDLMDGKIYKPGEPRPSLPAHWRCRCLYTVVTPTWRDLGVDIDEMADTGRTTVKHTGKTVHHKDGSTSTKFKVAEVDRTQPGETYSDWMKRQMEEDPAFVRRVLGKTRFELFKAGKLSLSGMAISKRPALKSDDAEAFIRGADTSQKEQAQTPPKGNDLPCLESAV